MRTLFRIVSRMGFTLVLFGLLTAGAFAQLNGSYTIDSSSPTGGTNFQTFGAAASALNTNGVSGPVVIDVVAGSYVEQVSFTAIPGASPVNSITLNGHGDTLAFAPPSSSKFVMELSGAKYMTIDSLVIVSTSTTYGYGILLRNSADSNTIKNCLIDLSGITSTSSTNSAGIVSSNSATSATSGSDNANYLTLTDNEIIGGYYNIRLNGSTGGINAVGNVLTGNVVRDFYQYGIYLDDNDGAQVNGNDVSRANRTGVTTFYGIYLTSGNRNVLIEKNRIHNTHDVATSLTGSAYAVYFSGCDAPVGEENQVINNLVYNFNGNGTVYAIYNSSSNGAWYYHNTISLDNAASTGGTTRGFYQTTTASNIQFFNNLISITRGGNGVKTGIYFNSTGSTITSDNNSIFLGGSGSGAQHVGYYSGVQTTLAAWQSANSSAYGQNTVLADPFFTDLANNDLKPTGSLLDNIGANIGVVADFDGVVRTSTPDPGAFEFTPPANDAGISALLSPDPACAGSNNLVIELTNFGADTLDSVQVNWTVNGGSTSNQNYIGTVNPGANAVVSLGAINITGSTDIVVWTTMPNGVVDANTSNDTLTVAGLVPGLAAGTYTINSAVATGGTNYQSFTDAVSAMALSGICGPVVFNVMPGSGPYVEQVIVPSIFGTNSTNTITINGNGDTLAFAPSATNKFVLRLNGVDHLTIDSLAVVSTSTTYGYGILLSNASDSNTIKNCVIDISGVTSTTSTNSIGIGASASTTSSTTGGNNANYLTLDNNEVIGGYYGIRLNGNTGGLDATNNIVENNSVHDFYLYGIYLDDNTNPRVRFNDVHRANRVTVSTFYGIYFTSGCSNGLIEKNTIHNTHDNASSLTGTAYGIYFTGADAAIGSENRVINNQVYNFNGNGTSYGIYNSSSNGAWYYHNTVSLDHAGSTAGTTYGFYQTTTASNIEFRNNVVSVTRGGSGNKYALYFNATGSSILSDNNGLFVGGAGSGTLNYGRYGSDFATFADWQGANSNAYDQNSAGAAPQFADIANNDYTPGAAAFNNIGAALGVVDDFNGVARNTTPDPGAFEFTPPLDDAGISSLLAPSPACSGLNTLEVALTNFGADTLDSVQVFWTVNGGGLDSTTYMGPLLPGGITGINLGTINITGATNIVAWTKGPNNMVDADLSNDTLNVVGLVPALSAGTYSINSAVATGGTNYQSFTDAANDLINLGICGPVVFEVVAGSGPYVEQVSLPAIVGASAVNTITFNGKMDTLSFQPVSAARHIFQLFGAKHITIDSLVMVSTSATYGYGVHLINGADSNTISNSVIDLSGVTSTSSSNSTGIVASGSGTSVTTSGNNANYLQLIGNEVIGGYYGIRLNGNSGGLDAVGNKVLDNEVRDFRLYGIYLDDNDDALVQDNDVHRANRVAVSTFYGIYLTAGNRNVLIERNRIHNTHDNASSLTGSAYAIYFSGCDAPVGEENIAVNNLIYNFNSNGTVYAIYNSSSNGAYYYHNTISLDHTTATGGTTRGFYQTTTASNVEFRNNLISITRGGSGTKHAIYFNATGSTILSNNNALYVNSLGSGAQHYGRYSTDFTTFANWQTANSSAYDQNSVSSDPLFLDLLNLDFTPGDTTLNNKGAALSISEDFFGSARSLTAPDPGAIEFDVILNDVSFTAYLEPDTLTCDTDSQAVRVIVTNNGLLSQTAVPVTVNVSGSLTTTMSGTSGTLASMASDTIMLGYLNTVGATTLNFAGNTGLVGDQVIDNDSLTRQTVINASPSVTLGNDTSLCAGDSLLLDAGTGFTSYDWNNGTAATQTFMVSAAGTYEVEVTNSNGCTATDEIVVSYFTAPVVNLGADTSVCNGDSLTLDAGAGFTYDWNNGGAVTQTIVVNTAGSYSVEITDGNTCVTSDTFVLSINSLPAVNLGADTAICMGSSVTLDAGAGFSYSWNGGTDTTQTIVASTAGTSFVVITDGLGCTNTDSLVLTVNALPTVALGSDTGYCAGSAFSLTLDAGAGFTYDWNNGAAATQTFTVTADGTFSVVITDGNGCTNTDSLVVVENALPVVDLGADTNLCGGDVLLDAGAGFTYEWSDASTSQTLLVDVLGTYAVTVTDGNGCTNSDSVFVDDCISVSEIAQARFRIYPNPAIDQVWITGSTSDETIQVEVTDLTGKVVKLSQVRLASGATESLELSNLSTGTYLVRLIVGDQLEVHRVVVR